MLSGAIFNMGLAGILIDETGKTFGKLLVVKRGKNPPGAPAGAYWWCQCTCGKWSLVRGANLRQGNWQSCGKAPCTARSRWPKPLELVETTRA